VPESRDRGITGLPDLPGAVLIAVAVGALALALVKGPDWGWSAPATLAGFAVSVICWVVFWLRSARHPLPVIEPRLLRVRAFAWSNVTMLIFSVAFAVNLLAGVLWMQQIWGYSALRTGFAIAPGPLIVPVFAAIAQSVAHRVPVGRITAVGTGLSGISALIIIFSLHAEPAYATEYLPAWLIGGAGVGLTLPTLLSAATADLPATQAATGSAVVNMSRQIGTVLGVSAVVALLGSPHGYAQAHHGFQHVWWFSVICAVLATPAALSMTPRSRPGAPVSDQRDDDGAQTASRAG
jgi:hypothetical protein